MKRLAGFTLLIGTILLILYLMSNGVATQTLKKNVKLGKPVVFKAKEQIQKIANKDKKELPEQQRSKADHPESQSNHKKSRLQPEKQKQLADTDEVDEIKPDIKSELAELESARKTEHQLNRKSSEEKKSNMLAKILVNLPANPEPAGVKIREIVVSDEDFRKLDSLQEQSASGKVSTQKGRYNWGVLEKYENPDEAARLLGGIAVAKNRHNGQIYTLRKSISGVVAKAIPIDSFGNLYGETGLPCYSDTPRTLLAEAIKTGSLFGKESDYELWYIFPKTSFNYIQGKVVEAFECTIKSKNMNSLEAENFRKEARLRAEVIRVSRTGGGELGCFVPRYFDYKKEEIKVPETCLQKDEEWQIVKARLNS